MDIFKSSSQKPKSAEKQKPSKGKLQSANKQDRKFSSKDMTKSPASPKTAGGFGFASMPVSSDYMPISSEPTDQGRQAREEVASKSNPKSSKKKTSWFSKGKKETKREESPESSSTSIEDYFPADIPFSPMRGMRVSVEEVERTALPTISDRGRPLEPPLKPSPRRKKRLGSIAEIDDEVEDVAQASSTSAAVETLSLNEDSR